MTAANAPVVVASFNVHAGIDGWGRAWDVVSAVRRLEADVVILQEVWSPDGRPSTADAIGSALGYDVLEHSLARGRRAGPHPRADGRWMRRLDWRGAGHALYLDSYRPLSRASATTSRFRHAEPGSWGLAVLSRLPILEHRVVELGRLPRDRVSRSAIVAQLDAGGTELLVAGSHMAHLTYGSPVQFLRLRRALEVAAGSGPAVLAGDMNLWGPPASLLLWGWHRTVRGRTWPSWRPHSQVDHIFVKGPLALRSAEVMPDWGSDHRAVRARLELR